ncbi:MAG: glycosyltransferase family 4 protein [Acidimicrobiia bacterium]
MNSRMLDGQAFPNGPVQVRNDRAGRLLERVPREPLTVGIVAPPWIPIPPPAYGGTEAVLDNLICGLVDLGVRVVVVAHGDSRIAGAEVLGGPCAPSGSAIGVTTTEMEHVVFAYDALLRRGVDVIHDHTLVGPLVGAARHAPIPIVTTNHGLFDVHLRPIFRELGRVSSVVAISHSQARTAGDVPIAAVIHHGVRPERFPVGRGDGGYALFLGRMSPAKGVVQAIQAARAAGVRLVIAAKCWEHEEVRFFEREVAPLLGDDVEFVGELGGARKMALLGGAVALLNPIQWDEPFGMTMIEALACGTPVIVTPRGAAPELVDDGITGFLCAGERELVEALQGVGRLNRRACRTAVTERFSAARNARRHVDLYERVVGRRHGAGRVAAVAP